MLVRALASFAGGPKPGSTDEVPDHLGEMVTKAGLAIEVTSLRDRLPGGEFTVPSYAEAAQADAALTKNASREMP